MIRVLASQKGEGKTKAMIYEANEKVHYTKGHIIYIDNCTSHRYSLSCHIRLVEACTFPIHSPNHFIGFLCGILSANHDIETIFIDELLQLAHLSIQDLEGFLIKLQALSDRTKVDFIIGATCRPQDLPSSVLQYLSA